MKPQELRIENYFKWISTNKIDTVKNIVSYDKLECNINSISISDCEPIKITEDWLVKFGFQKEEMEEGEGHYYSLRLNNSIYCDLTLLGVFENGVWEVVLFPYGKFFRFKYINQVQNIVFELTGKELDNKY